MLPGDNADNGLPAQYRLVSTVPKMLSVPVYALPGDHDMEQGGLDAFYRAFSQHRLPFAITIRGIRCLFLDVCGAGSGGPDFRLGQEQIRWIDGELKGASARGETITVFMHTYPDDLKGNGETAVLNRLFAAYNVALVDMGHTHYNELANDGHTIFATRSTGQIDEGPVGYSIATLDHGVVSWRFKALDDSFPFVVITLPADRRLLRSADHIATGSCDVRALVCGSRKLRSVACQVSGGDWIEMRQLPGQQLWTASRLLPASGSPTILVRAIDQTGRPGQDQIEVATRGEDIVERKAVGSDAASIGAWTENGIFGTQLGPNRNARPAA